MNIHAKLLAENGYVGAAEPHGKYAVCVKCAGTGLLMQGSRCCHVCNGSGWAASRPVPETEA